MTVEYEVYEPEEDSYLLSKYVKQFTNKNDKVLEIGVGSGIQCESALNVIEKDKGKGVVVGLDINPRAVKHCIESKYTQGSFFYESNLFETLKKKVFDFKNKTLSKKTPKVEDNKFDLIIFNPPYLPDANDAEEVKYITTGGKHGFEIIDDFMKDVSKFLNPEGKILMVFSNLTKKNKVDEIIEKNYLFKYELLEEQSIFFEKLYCYKIEKIDLLKELECNGMESISYLSKGKRGIVYQGIINNKELNLSNQRCVIKVQSEKTNAIDVIRKESDWTIKMNKFGIGPKYYLSKHNIADKIQFISREFIEGDLILDWMEKNKENKESIKEILLDILNQCYILDQNRLEKQEMTKPLKHIIITRDNKPVQIDFERVRNVQIPSNVTQYLQFLSSRHLQPYIDVDREETVNLSKEYLEKKSTENIIKYLNNKIN